MAKTETLFLRLNQKQQVNTIIKIIDLSILVFHDFIFKDEKAPTELLRAIKVYHNDPTDANRELFNLANNAFNKLSEKVIKDTLEIVDRASLHNAIAAIQQAASYLYDHTNPELMSNAKQSIDLACKSDSFIIRVIRYFMDVQTGKAKAHKHPYMD